MHRISRADVIPVRQRTQYSCVAASLAMCLRAQGVDCSEDEVAKVMGCQPMRGASWEDCIAAAQHYGMRASLVCPSTIEELRSYTDRGTPAIIGWNPEGRDWSHASVVFDVSEDGSTVCVADPNIPDPSRTTRRVAREDFYRAWVEKWPNYLVRRPAVYIEREINEMGKPITASKRGAMRYLTAEDMANKLASARRAAGIEDDKDEHRARFEECPTEEPCMTVDEVAAVVGPEFKEQNEKQPKFKPKPKS